MLVEIESRYWYPQYAWRRYRSELNVALPRDIGEITFTRLPPPHFGYNAAHSTVLELQRRSDRVTMYLQSADGYGYIATTWVQTRLWTRVRFDPGHPDLRTGWWFQYRTPFASYDILSLLDAGLAELQTADDINTVQETAQRMRREIVMHKLGGPTP